jgi:DNA polymerase V
VVSRSEEAKKLGIGMGVPYFQIKNLLRQAGGQAFSSNFELYADLSNRVMTVLRDFTPEMEIYSIDEAFLRLNYCSGTSYLRLADQIKNRVQRETGIPVSVGLATTKTLAKAANELAKQQAIFGGTLSLLELTPAEIDEYLQLLAIEDVWGVGRRSSAKLRALGVRTAFDLTQASEALVRQLLTVTGLRTALELKGEACLELEEGKQAQSVIVSRSFGQLVTLLGEIKEALASHIVSGCKRLRGKGVQARYLTIFLNTNVHRPQDQQHFVSQTLSLAVSSNYHGDFLRLALPAVAKLFRPGCLYKKVGVVFSGLAGVGAVEQDLFSGGEEAEAKKNLVSQVLDQVNARYGRGSLVVGSMGLRATGRGRMGFGQKWQMKNEMRSGRFTTRWEELGEVG